jgi:hypothetical protein
MNHIPERTGRFFNFVHGSFSARLLRSDISAVTSDFGNVNELASVGCTRGDIVVISTVLLDAAAVSVDEEERAVGWALTLEQQDPIAVKT